jgi:hypothetical protein
LLINGKVFQRLSKQLKLLNVIELQYVSPKLMAVRDLDIAVPGTYQSGKPVVGIGMVLPTFQVISSKQRPRKFSLRGRDGKEYMFLLKGELAFQASVVLTDVIQGTRICAKMSESCSSSVSSTRSSRPIRNAPSDI